jgi:hypothetical protein
MKNKRGRGILMDHGDGGMDGWMDGWWVGYYINGLNVPFLSLEEKEGQWGPMHHPLWETYIHVFGLFHP